MVYVICPPSVSVGQVRRLEGARGPSAAASREGERGTKKGGGGGQKSNTWKIPID